MKRIIFILAMIIAHSLSNAQQNITTSINSFSFNVLEQLQSSKENCFYSPYSIFSALSMTYAGTKKETQLEFEKVLMIDSKENVHNDIKKITNSTSGEREITVLTSNSLWLKESLKPEKSFIEILEQQYNTEVQKVNFADENKREKARKQINEFVEKQTKGNIVDFLQKGILDESASMVLINAVYFSAIWKTEFPVENIKPENFLLPSGDSVKCNMMNNSVEINYFEDNQMQIVELPYQSNKASMLIFLPKADVKITPTNFNADYLQQISKSFNSKLVNIGIPRYKMETSYELSDGLKKMGMKSAFTPEGDFSGISGSEKLYIDKILHKSKLDVSEKGTEASSATAVISMRSTKIAQDPIEFKANRPFYFIIRDNEYKLILFMGYVANPGLN